MSQSFKHLSRALLLSGAFLLVSASPAVAAAPCWKQLLNDWYDGTINKIYPLPCYQDAVSHLPPDVADYSSAKDDILRALANAKKNKPAPPESSTAPGPTVTTPDLQPPKKKGGFSGAIAKITPGDPQSFPLPLLILGALAILLVAAGGAGMIWRRYQDRGPGTT